VRFKHADKLLLIAIPDNAKDEGLCWLQSHSEPQVQEGRSHNTGARLGAWWQPGT
jgi:hypothetical protein